MQTYAWETLTDADRSELLERPATAANDDIRHAVAEIIETVRENGDQALLDYAKLHEQCALDTVLCTDQEIDAAERATEPAVRRAIDAAIANVRKFHSAQLRQPLRIETAPGVVCERVVRPIDAVGLYVPAGSAPLPSTAIMLGVPATLAGCANITLASPPTSDGRVDSSVLCVAKRLGIRTVVKAGGAQAIAAMAFGTQSISPSYKIFGPGNIWATEAKVQISAMSGGAAIDMPAGPSELMIIADSSANPVYVCADLLSQAEHGPDSQVLLVTTDPALAEAVQSELERQRLKLSRHEIAGKALENSRTLVVASRKQALDIANTYAPEHLILQIRDPRSALAGIRNAGSVFLGHWTPESVGDYCSGTNHVLPTYGYARSYSGLSSDAFCRTMTVQECSASGLAEIGPVAETLAAVEGLGAHANAVRVRLDSMTSGKRTR